MGIVLSPSEKLQEFWREIKRILSQNSKRIDGI